MGGGGRQGGPPPPPSRESRPATSPLPAVNNERGNLLASIRAGKQLKKVTNDESARGPSPPAEGNLDGMAGALARALQQRNNVMQHSGMYPHSQSLHTNHHSLFQIPRRKRSGQRRKMMNGAQTRLHMLHIITIILIMVNANCVLPSVCYNV